MKRIALSEVKDRFSEYLDMAEKEEIIITRHGKPAGVLIGFGSEEDWFDYRLEHDPGFLARVASARESLKKDKGIRIENLSDRTLNSAIPASPEPIGVGGRIPHWNG